MEVYARYGLAMYEAQCIERGLGVLLATAWGPGPGQITRQEYEGILQSTFTDTLGRLIRHVREKVGAERGLETDLTRVLRTRNWLAHHYFWQRAQAFCSEKGRHAMVAELQGIVDEFERVNTVLSRIAEAWLKALGVTEDEVESRLRALMEDIQ